MLVKSPELGAQPSVYLAVSEELEGVTGHYYDVMTEKEPAPQALDDEVARKLWELSSSLVGLEKKTGEQTDGSKTTAGVKGRAAQTETMQTHGHSPGAAVGAATV